MLVSTIAAAIRSSKHQLRGPTSKIAVVARVGRDHSAQRKTARSCSSVDTSSERFDAPAVDHFLRAGAGISSASSGSSERHRYQLARERCGRQRLACRRIAAGVTGRPRR
jgi:hypothetical protein